MRRASQEARGRASKGATKAKLALRLDLADEVDRVSGALVTYAEIAEDTTLAVKSPRDRSMITRGRELTATFRATNLLDLARKHGGDGALAGYGLTPALLDRFATLIDTFSNELGRPREVIVQGKLARGSLSALFAAADKHLHQMDRLAAILAQSASCLRGRVPGSTVASSTKPRPAGAKARESGQSGRRPGGTARLASGRRPGFLDWRAQRCCSVQARGFGRPFGPCRKEGPGRSSRR